MIAETQLGEYTDCQTPRRPFLLGVNSTEKRAVLFRPRCKLWSCPFCAQINRGFWAVRAYQGAQHFQEIERDIDFLTLTSHERLGPEATLAVFPHAWKNLSMRARRKAQHFDYLLIPERHDDGRLHVHAIETASLGSRWWKDKARECGLGFMNEESEVRSPQGAAAYVVKYLTKSIAYEHWPQGFRRIRTSRSWPKVEPLPPLPGWQWQTLKHNTQLDEVHAKFEAAGYQIAVMGSNEAWRFISMDVDVT